MAENRRWHAGWPRSSRGHDPEPGPWRWVGWVGIETPWGVATRLGPDRYRGAWAVWLGCERRGRFADDPYP
jgi:hypothetical protein